MKKLDLNKFSFFSAFLEERDARNSQPLGANLSTLEKEHLKKLLGELPQAERRAYEEMEALYMNWKNMPKEVYKEKWEKLVRVKENFRQRIYRIVEGKC